MAEDSGPGGLNLIIVIVSIALLVAIIGLLSIWGCNRWQVRKEQKNTQLSVPYISGPMTRFDCGTEAKLLA